MHAAWERVSSKRHRGNAMADASRWYYAVSNERQGPLGTDEMVALRRAGSIQDETLVWTDGMTDWSPLRDTPLGQSPIPPVPGVPPPFAPGVEQAPQRRRGEGVHARHAQEGVDGDQVVHLPRWPEADSHEGLADDAVTRHPGLAAKKLLTDLQS